MAEDHVLDWPVFEHALTFLKREEGFQPHIVVHLRPTVPYRKTEWIDEAVSLLLSNPRADSVRSVSKPREHPYRIFKINSQGFLDPIMKNKHPSPYLIRRQEWPDMYFYNCVIDVTRPETILEKKSMTGDRILPYIMNSEDVIDIDTLRDLEFAKAILEK